jgi:hypothetical protein
VRRFIGILLLIFALLQFGYRAAERARSEVPLWDFDSVYCAARTWIHGGDPYDLSSVVATWNNFGVYSGHDVSYFATVYPPNSLCMLAPFALLPVTPAMLAWLALTLALVALQFAALADVVGLRWRDSRLLILVAASLASAPFQFGILAGQLSQPAISLCILAFWCACRDLERTAGVLLGIACAIKPQIAAPFVLYYLMMRRWSVGGIAAGLSAVVVGIALIAMKLSHIDWLAGWTQSIAITTRIGAVNDYGWTGYFRDEIMDLKLLLVSIIHNPRILRLGVESTVLVLGLWYLRVMNWRPQSGPQRNRDELLMLAGLTAISFLAIYHRVYDAALLATALAWALAELDGPRRPFAIAMLVPMGLFLIPFDITGTVGRRVHLLATLSQTGWWQTLIAPHYAWALLGLTLAILVTMTKCLQRGFQRGLIHSATTTEGISPVSQRSPTLQGS